MVEKQPQIVSESEEQKTISVEGGSDATREETSDENLVRSSLSDQQLEE